MRDKDGEDWLTKRQQELMFKRLMKVTEKFVCVSLVRTLDKPKVWKGYRLAVRRIIRGGIK